MRFRNRCCFTSTFLCLSLGRSEGAAGGERAWVAGGRKLICSNRLYTVLLENVWNAMSTDDKNQSFLSCIIPCLCNRRAEIRRCLLSVQQRNRKDLKYRFEDVWWDSSSSPSHHLRSVCSRHKSIMKPFMGRKISSRASRFPLKSKVNFWEFPFSLSSRRSTKRIKASKSDPTINYGLDTFKMFGWLVESALPIKSIWNWFQSWARSLAAFDTSSVGQEFSQNQIFIFELKNFIGQLSSSLVSSP